MTLDVKPKTELPATSNNFDALRLGLAVLVIYSHSYALGLGSEATEPLYRLTRGQMSLGALAVDLFFVLSGYLITASAEKSSSVGSYLKKRVRRIYPAFIVNAILSVVIVVPLAHAVIASPAWGNFALQTLRLCEFEYSSAFSANPFPGPINGSLWSIQYEFWCYLGVAALASFGLLRRKWLLLASFVASVGVSVLWQVKGIVLGGKFLGQLLGSPQLWARMLPLYLAGVVAYLFRDRIRLNARGAVLALIVLIGASFVSLGWTLVFPAAGTYLALYLAFAPWLRLHGAARLGDFSYGTYLYAFPIAQIIMSRFGHEVPPWQLFVLATPLTLLAAIASWYGVERWFVPRARRNEAVRSSAGAQAVAVTRSSARAVLEARADS
ncbi:acyltransferase family protein [Bryocella elongata]|uniref:acyltransferase family protein n=1 Tax=Bryocella elongata TaxID=863522 RepID=UPI00135B76CF|nr:acyltransferase [Bryocella elongata]